jgi:hypothetical protein
MVIGVCSKGGDWLPGFECPLNAVIQPGVGEGRGLDGCIILFLIGNFSSEGFELERSILVGLEILTGEDIGLRLLGAIIKIVRWFILEGLQAGVHDLLVFVHGSEGLRDAGVEGRPARLKGRGRRITGLFK